MPKPHEKHSVAPLRSLIVPGIHDTHAPLFSKLPAGQLVHSDAAEPDVEPGEHEMQEDAASPLYLPLEHGEHEEAPVGA